MIIDQTTVEPKVLSEKVGRKILGTGGSLMMVEVIFKKGGVGEVHAHDTHEQVSYIVKGSFEVIVGTEKRIVSSGDSFYAGLNVPHGVIALEDAVILDVFTPIREDFLEPTQP
jgi:quercetin dioxygenase-like cupin family protein